MAVDDVGFYNLTGEEITRGSLVDQMIGYYQLKLEVGDTKVTDFNEGSEIRNLLEAFAVDLYILMEEQNELTSIGFVDSADGEWLDKHGANPFINLPRDTGSESHGSVVFTIPTVATEELLIGEGTIVVSDDGLEFETDGDGIIAVGETSCTVSVTCLTTGEDGNVGAGEVNTIDDEYIDIDGLTVTNTEAFTNGTDYEEDEEYRERLLAYLRQDDFGSVGYYTRLGESVDGVHDIVLLDKTGYTKNVIVNGDTKPVDTSVLADVLAEFSDISNIVVGHTFNVEPVTLVDANLTFNLQVNEELAEEDIISTLTAFFNGGNGYYILEFDGLYIGETITKDKLSDVLFMMDGIESVEIIDKDTSEPLTELTCQSNEVFQLGNITINQTIAS